MKVNKKGFTLMEIVIAVLIIGVLAAVAVPAYMRAMEKSKATEAIQALSDIAKGEIDYYYAQNKYTDDFSDLSISQINKATKELATGSTYTTESFEYELNDTQNLTTAKRTMGNDAYTLYRFFEDPRTYCQPEGNKYCELLGLEAGTFSHSVGRWQSCEGGVYPCTKACTRDITVGYTCTGTYNEDGTFREKVCDTNNVCLTTQYNEDEKGLKQSFCYSYDANGRCTGGGETTYDEDGNLLSYKKCTAWAEDGSCTAGTGQVYTYDANGNRTSEAKCTAWNSDGTCKTYGTSGYVYTYDANGNQTSSAYCTAWNSDGTCTYGTSGNVYTYDENGNKTSYAYCTAWNSDGTCAQIPSRYCYYTDANGNQVDYSC